MSPLIPPSAVQTIALALATLGASTAMAMTTAKPPAVGKAPQAQLASKQQTPAQRLEQRVQQALERARAGQVEQAIAQLQSVLDEQPEHPDTRLVLAALHAARGDLIQAQKMLHQGLAADPGHTNLRMHLARVQVQAGHPQAALHTLESGPATQLTADYRAFHAVLLQTEAQHHQAIVQYALALREQPYRAQWLVGIAVSLSALGLTEAAREAFERAGSAPDFNRRLADVVAQYGVIP